MIKIETENYTRVTWATARKLYEAGKEVFLLPCKFNPESPWALIHNPGYREKPFADYVVEYEHYNCNRETGRYTAFYIRRSKAGETV